MTNNRYPEPTPGSSTREIEEHHEHWSNAPAGSHYANALAFIVDSINDGHFLGDIEELDYESMMEFAEMYNFTEESLRKAIDAFRKAAITEVTGTR